MSRQSDKALAYQRIVSFASRMIPERSTVRFTVKLTSQGVLVEAYDGLLSMDIAEIIGWTNLELNQVDPLATVQERMLERFRELQTEELELADAADR